MNFGEFTGDVSGVAIQNGAVTVFNLSGVVHDDDLSQEVFDFHWGVVLGVSTDVSSLDVLDGETLNVESDIVSGNGFGD